MSSSPSKATPDSEMKKLRKLEQNMVCPNCGTKAPVGLGFGNVCVKFNTFVCDLCKFKLRQQIENLTTTY